MSFKSIITKNVVSETLSKVVSLLSSASFNLSAEQIKTLVDLKIKDTNCVFDENNDIGYCVSRLMEVCAYGQIKSVEDLNEKYSSIRESDELITETISMMAEGIAKHISSPLYELREVIPQETKILVNQINEQIPVIESLQDKNKELCFFNWGKLQDQNFLTTTMLFAKDKTVCFKDGVVRQHDSVNILNRVPYGTHEKFQTDKAFETNFLGLIEAEIDGLSIEDHLKTTLKYYSQLTISLISNDKVFHQTISSFKESLLSNMNLSASIVNIVERCDAVEDILRLITVQLLDKDESISAVSAKIISNVENVLINISLIRASLIFHKIHTLQNKLILSKNVVQESAMKTFREAGGTDQMVKDHFTYMELNELSKIPTNGLSLDVVLNSSAKAKSVVQKNTEILASRAAANKVKALQDAVTYGLHVHYKTGLESGTYKPILEMIHDRQVSVSVSKILKKSVDDIALEYLVTLRNNDVMKSFFKAINAELHDLVKNGNTITQDMIQTALCSGVVSVIFNRLVKDFAVQKEAV